MDDVDVARVGSLVLLFNHGMGATNPSWDLEARARKALAIMPTEHVQELGEWAQKLADLAKEVVDAEGSGADSAGAQDGNAGSEGDDQGDPRTGEGPDSSQS